MHISTRSIALESSKLTLCELHNDCQGRQKRGIVWAILLVLSGLRVLRAVLARSSFLVYSCARLLEDIMLDPGYTREQYHFHFELPF